MLVVLVKRDCSSLDPLLLSLIVNDHFEQKHAIDVAISKADLLIIVANCRRDVILRNLLVTSLDVRTNVYIHACKGGCGGGEREREREGKEEGRKMRVACKYVPTQMQ